MRLPDALTQLAILGATSIVLANGRTIPMEHADWLLDDRSSEFALHARAAWVDVIDARGRLFARARTLWSALPEPKRATG
jgi:hypothetical protein